MADTHGHGIQATADGGHGHGDGLDPGHGPGLMRLYLSVAVVLLICTAASFVVNQFVSAKMTAFFLILLVACIKAFLVVTYFMHLKWDWKLLYFLIVPAFILGAMMAVVFLPDIFFGTMHDAQDQIAISRRLTEGMQK